MKIQVNILNKIITHTISRPCQTAMPHSLANESQKFLPTEDVPPSSIPLDIALIVVASIVSLGLTSVAVVMVLHMRSKLVETVRLSVYDDEKTKSQERETAASSNSRISTIVSNGGLPRKYHRPSIPLCNPNRDASRTSP